MENKPIKPAQRLSAVQEYYFSRKLKEVARLNAEGRDIISLAIGSPDMPPSDETVEKLCQVAHDPTAHGYQPTMGTPELRRAMSGFYKRWYGVGLDPDSELLPLIGSKEGILHVTLAFVNPGERVLVPNPGYPTYTSLPRLLGADVVSYDLKPAADGQGWQPDFGQIERIVSDPSAEKPVKMLWMNYPHMPTGTPARMETFERAVGLARRYGIVVVHDNPYSLILNKEKPLSILQVEGARECCIELNSMSKSHNMPGWRVGLCASNAEFITWILKVQSNIESGTFRGIQLAAAKAYENSDEWHRVANVERYEQRRHIAEQIMRTLGCNFEPRQVGMFLWGRIPDSCADAEELTEQVLHQARVFITPGFIFGSNGNRYIRISLCAKEEKMRQALERIRQSLL